MASTNDPACRGHEPADELDRRSDLALDAVEHAIKEHVHWTLQHAYALLRAEFPTATSLLAEAVDGSEGTCLVLRVRAGEDDLWRRNASTGRADADGAVARAGEVFEEVLRHRAPDLLPGWTREDRVSVHYVADMTVLPPALSLRGEDSVTSRVPPGIHGLLTTTVDGWTPQARRAVREYSRGLVEGRYRPLESIADWHTVPAILGLPIPGNGFFGFGDRPGEIGADTWRSAIASVHGLAAGMVKLLGGGEMYGVADDLRMHVKFWPLALAKRGLTLRQVADAFGGDVRLAAATLVQALPVTDLLWASPTV
ncbi:hypothetical protein CU254_41895 (plasmid) [Amycolatopsis sp. AA4]|uniref:hypothetical protein n=1 Tax=Actinomycetes TaxID=1760 RepID=UPI0001B56C2C|nr:MULTISPECIES: hypothetical protein [Actinomycetes]ATY17132.1 hypothetical protein CU254_41895 [Amycolatopsis sp. AA4]